MYPNSLNGFAQLGPRPMNAPMGQPQNQGPLPPHMGQPSVAVPHHTQPMGRPQGLGQWAANQGYTGPTGQALQDARA